MIVFAADLHLAPLIWQDYPALCNDAYYAWNQIVNFCLEKKPTALILGGDVWNRSRPDPDSVVRFVRSVDVLEMAGITVYAIQGQHERATPPWTAVHQAIEYIGDGQLVQFSDPDIGQFSLRGFDCQSTSNIRDAMKQGNAATCDVLVIHQLARQVMNIEGAWDFDEMWAPAEIKLILAGDYHQHGAVGRLCYSGSTHMRDITERSPRVFVTVGKDFKIEWQPLEQRAVIEVLVLDEDHLKEAIATIVAYKYGKRAEVIDRPVVYARINADVPKVVERLQAACELDDEAGGKFLKTKIVGGGTEVVEAIQLPDGEITLETCLNQAVDRDQSPELHSFVLELLKSKEPRLVCEETRAKLGL